MNKPATKEPSMDEILSSIRQIIADDDAAAAPPPPRPAPAAAAPKPVAVPRAAPAEPLALSAAQIVQPAPKPAQAATMDFASVLGGLEEVDQPDEPEAEMLVGEAQLIDPEDIAFEAEPEPEPEPVALVPEPEPPRAAPPRPAMSVAQAAPMPDPTLSSDMAEQLLAPATDAAVQGAMSRLGSAAGMGLGGMTVEAMIRDMLRPMLKEWLDENLPALVEGMVEKEIARISRGVK